MTIVIGPNDKVKVGSIIEIFVPNSELVIKNKFKRFSGKWLVSSISHDFSTLRNYSLTLSLIRDSIDYDINESEEPVSIFTVNSYDKAN